MTRSSATPLLSKNTTAKQKTRNLSSYRTIHRKDLDSINLGVCLTIGISSVALFVVWIPLSIYIIKYGEDKGYSDQTIQDYTFDIGKWFVLYAILELCKIWSWSLVLQCRPQWIVGIKY